MLLRVAPLSAVFLTAMSIIGVQFSGHASAAETEVNIVLDDLHRPAALAVRPGGTADRYEIFIAESGAGRVVRWSSESPETASEVISGFVTKDGAARDGQAGPAALLFLDRELLVVGASTDDRFGPLRSYELPDDGSSLTADQAMERSAKSKDAEEPALPAQSTCFAASRSRANEFVPDMILAARRVKGDDAQLFKCRVQAGIFSSPQLMTSTNSASPTAIATSHSGRFLVADSAGKLTFFNPMDGKAELELPTGLKQITGLAYSPTHRRLYAADFASGIHRIDDASVAGRPACKVVKFVNVARPNGLAFAPDGTLYVTAFGADDADGTLSVVSGDL